MKLKKVGGIYHASFRTAAGKTKSITTRCTNLEDARKAAADIADLELAARAGRLTNEAISHITTGRKMTMVKALESFEEWARMTNAGRTAYCQVKIIEQWIKSQDIENLPPSAINEMHIHRFINNPESDSKLGTRNTSLSAIRTFFTFATAKGWASHDPSKLVRVKMNIIPHELKEKAERQCFTRAEIKAILDYEAKRIEGIAMKQARIEWGRTLSPAQRTLLLTMAPEQVAKAESNPLVAAKLADSWKEIITQERARALHEEIFWTFAVTIGDELGLRLGDICQLEWECFRNPRTVIVWTDKRDRRIEVPISERIDELLTQIPVRDSKYLFPEQREIINDDKRRAVLSNTFLRACRRIGIQGKSYHSLRHATLTRWKKEGMSLEDIAVAAGHGNTKATEGYLH